MNSTPLIEITRGDYIESVHHGTVAVVDSSGKLHSYWSTPEQATFMRSSAKPFQALPFLESGTAQSLGIRSQELALVCASHRGLEQHVRILKRLLERTGLPAEQLQCGLHRPLDREAAWQLKEARQEPSILHNNCAGKHIGMLATAKHLGHSTKDYLDPEHPVQSAILNALSEVAGFEAAQIGIATDGCSAPNFSIPIESIALAFARLADPVGQPNSRKRALNTIFRSMAEHPELISGPGKLDARLMQASTGNLVAKEGAEGVLGLALQMDKGRGLGVAIKVWDGDRSGRALAASALAVLSQLGWLTAQQRSNLEVELSLSVETRRGIPVGKVRPIFQLEPAHG